MLSREEITRNFNEKVTQFEANPIHTPNSCMLDKTVFEEFEKQSIDAVFYYLGVVNLRLYTCDRSFSSLAASYQYFLAASLKGCEKSENALRDKPSYLQSEKEVFYQRFYYALWKKDFFILQQLLDEDLPLSVECISWLVTASHLLPIVTDLLQLLQLLVDRMGSDGRDFKVTALRDDVNLIRNKMLVLVLRAGGHVQVIADRINQLRMMHHDGVFEKQAVEEKYFIVDEQISPLSRAILLTMLIKFNCRMNSADLQACNNHLQSILSLHSEVRVVLLDTIAYQEWAESRQSLLVLPKEIAATIDEAVITLVQQMEAVKGIDKANIPPLLAWIAGFPYEDTQEAYCTENEMRGMLASFGQSPLLWLRLHVEKLHEGIVGEDLKRLAVVAFNNALFRAAMKFLDSKEHPAPPLDAPVPLLAKESRFVGEARWRSGVDDDGPATDVVIRMVKK